MRKTAWLRFGLTSLVITAPSVGALLVACGDNNDGTVGAVDAGPDVVRDTGPADTGPVDTGPPPPPPPANAKLTVVNAAADFGPNANAANGVQGIRFCFAVGATAAAATVQPLPPQPETSDTALPPALYMGSGAVLPDYGFDPQDVTIVPYLMNAKRLSDKGIRKPAAGQTGTTCKDLFQPNFEYDGGGQLQEGLDYWKVDPIPAKTFLHDKSYALVLTGCAADPQINPYDKCGYDFDGNPNFKISVFELDRTTTVPADSVGTQFIHASSPADRFFKNTTPATPVWPGYITDQATQTGYRAVTDFGPSSGTDGVAFLARISELKAVAGVDFAANGDSFTANPTVTAPPLAVKLADVEKLSGFAAGTYQAGKSYTFILVGDPDPATPATIGSAPNPRKYHFLAFPNDPTITKYQP